MNSFKNETLKTVNEVLENPNYEIITKVSDKTGNFLVMYKHNEAEKYSVIDLDDNKELFDQVNDLVNTQQKESTPVDVTSVKFKYELIRGWNPLLESTYDAYSVSYKVYVNGMLIGETLETGKDSYLGKGWHVIQNGAITKSNFKSRKKASQFLYEEILKK